MCAVRVALQASAVTLDRGPIVGAGVARAPEGTEMRMLGSHLSRSRRPGVLRSALCAVLASLAVGVGGAAAVDVPPPAVALLGEQSAPTQTSYAEVVAAAKRGELRIVGIDAGGRYVLGQLRSGKGVLAADVPDARVADGSPSVAGGLPTLAELKALMVTQGIGLVDVPQFQRTDRGVPLIMWILLAGLGLTATLWVIRAVQRRGGGSATPGSLGGHTSLGKRAAVEAPATRFWDVAGCEEVVAELQELVAFLKEPERFAKVGARMPRGVVLYGPPGTGKTLLARAVAGESEVPFFAASGSDFVELYVGTGAARVRDLFARASKSKNGAVIFIDEIDAIGKARGGAGAPGNDEREGTLNQLLVALDGFESDARVVVIAATNRLDTLDPALLRPGRFDRRVQVGLPDVAGRRRILGLHAAGKPLADVTGLDRLATITAGLAGADLALVLNEAAIVAGRAGRDSIDDADLQEGHLRALAGPVREAAVRSEDEREIVAWHEAGHALAAELCDTHDKTQLVSIRPRGQAGGMAVYGRTDRDLHSPRDVHERMVVALAGRAAEQLRFRAISSGASNDLEQVNALARTAVEQLGFSDAVGQIVSSANGRAISLSASTRDGIDREVGRLVDEAYTDALELLEANMDLLDRIAMRLLAGGDLHRAEIEEICRSAERVMLPAGRSETPHIVDTEDREPLDGPPASRLAAAASRLVGVARRVPVPRPIAAMRSARPVPTAQRIAASATRPVRRRGVIGR